MKRRGKNNHATGRGGKIIFSRYVQAISRFARSRDFADVENSSKAGEVIQQLASIAVKGAISEAKARGITRVYAVDDEIISENSNGDKMVIGHVETGRKEFFIKYKQGTIMHAAKH